MGQVQIYSRLDQEAHKALQEYRISIGLPAVAEFQCPPKIIQIGEWVDQLSYQHLGKPWDFYVTGTFRPIIRRWRNPKGFAAVETYVQRAEDQARNIESHDIKERLASRSPSQGYVQRFFYDWTERLARGLQSRVDFFVGFEAGKLSGANHFHALLAANNLKQQMEHEAELFRGARAAGQSSRQFAENKGLLLWGYLYRTAGRSLVLPFDAGRGAGWYIAAAYIGKKQLSWDVSMGEHAESSPVHGGATDLTRSAELPRQFYHITLGRWHR
jgi:hypothetical protein